jgi:hypothetical protein
MASIEDFFATEEPVKWGSDVEKEIRRRIKLSIAAYSYEFLDVSIISDAEFDKMCSEINPKIVTGNKQMDKFFKESFDASTGQWIHKHPQIDGIKKLYQLYYEDNNA